MAGQFHSLALTENNELFAWGLGRYGRLGLNHTDTRAEPQRVLFKFKENDAQNGEKSS